MQPIESILAATDFSPGAALAVEQAASLAHTLGAKLTLLHVYQIPNYFFPDGSAYIAPPEVLTELTASVADQLAAAAAQARSITGGEVAVRSLEGAAADQIVRAAREGGFDLIVIGTHGRSGIKRLVLGSVAEQVVRHAECPVFTVREPVARAA